MPILDHFGILAPYYDRLIRLKHADQMVKIAGLPTPGMLLDAGGGTGRVADALKTYAGGVVVADLSLDMLRQAKSKGSLLPACSISEKLPFPNGAFDRIIMVDALHHVFNHQQTASELWRVLKPGGRIVIEEPDFRTIAVKLVALAEKLAVMRSHFLNPAAIQALFRGVEARTDVLADGFNAWITVEK